MVFCFWNQEGNGASLMKRTGNLAWLSASVLGQHWQSKTIQMLLGGLRSQILETRSFSQ